MSASGARLTYLLLDYRLTVVAVVVIIVDDCHLAVL